MKQVIIVGAGIAGLSAGIYALRSGFKAAIVEQHTVPGGNSTSWRRGPYLFEGGLHWLTGSAPDVPLHRIWRETGALTDNTPVHNYDPFNTVSVDGVEVNLYRDAERLRAHLLAISPEDRQAVNSLCNDIKRFSKMTMPVLDLGGVKVKNKIRYPLMFWLRMLPALLRVPALNKISVEEYGNRFKHPALRLLVGTLVNANFNVTSMMFTLGSLARGDGGYPEGGSIAMAKRMARRFEELGGKIRYGSPVDSVSRDSEGRANGVIVNGALIPGSAVIISSDAITAFDKLLPSPLPEEWTRRMKVDTTPIICTFVALGIETDLSAYPYHIRFALPAPLEYAGVKISSIAVNNYARYPNYAPEGHSALTILLTEDTYDFWKQCRQNGSYDAEKAALAEAVVEKLSLAMPEIKGKVAVKNVATPLTYERYSGTWRGAWMSVLKKSSPRRSYPQQTPSIPALYFAGQRVMSPGGLPVAVYTGRKAVQHFCRDTGTPFEGAAD
jgi:phytoene dehydrogenase-like protein